MRIFVGTVHSDCGGGCRCFCCCIIIIKKKQTQIQMQQINVVESMIAESNLNEIFICPDLDRPNFFFNHISGGCACEWNSCIEEVVRMINSNPSTNNKKKDVRHDLKQLKLRLDEDDDDENYVHLSVKKNSCIGFVVFCFFRFALEHICNVEHTHTMSVLEQLEFFNMG